VMPPATAAVLEHHNGLQSVQWSGNETLSRTIDTETDRLTFLHTGLTPVHANVRLSAIPMEQALMGISSNDILKRTFATTGSFEIPIRLTDPEKARGIRLHLLGASTDGTVVEQNGQIRRGKMIPIHDDATLWISHGPGLVMAWFEDGDVNPWHELAQENPLDIQSTGHIPLNGNFTTLVLRPASPSLFHIQTDSPVITSIMASNASPRIVVASEGADIPIFGLPETETRISFQAMDDGPLSGTADVVMSEVLEIQEGPGPKHMLEPGGSQIFSFTLTHSTRVGIGVKASADIATCSLMDPQGRTLGTGVVQMHDLKAGTYFMIIRSPSNSIPVEVQPVVVGIEPRGTDPPEEVIQQYMAMSEIHQEREEDSDE
jgi:hypothetical protein